MKKRRSQLLALMLSAAMIVPSISTAAPVLAEERTVESGTDSEEEITESVITDDEVSAYADEEIAEADGFVIADDTAAVSESEESVEAEETDTEEGTDESEASSAIDAVRELIAALPDAGTVTLDDADQIAEAEKAYETLNAADQETLDAEVYNGGQPYGRVLESAVWELASLQPVDNSTTLPAGTYTTETDPAYTVTSDKGKSTSSRVRTWTWTSITVDENGYATGTLTVDSSTYSSVQVNGQSYTRDENSASRTSSFNDVPVDLNSTMYISAASTSMPAPIAYKITTEIEEPTVEEPVELAVSNTTTMFKVTTAYLYKESNKLVISLSGTGYRNLYLGTYSEAVANGDNTDNWIVGDNSSGAWTFTIPLTEGQTYYPVVAISNTYYNRYLNGTNPISRAFYPRQFTIDFENNTLTTGDYDATEEYAVTNNISMFKPAETSVIETVGGPNSNGYKVTLNLAMQNTSFDQMYIGTYEEASAAEETIALDENNQFSFTVEKITTPGDTSSIVSKLDQEVVVCFHASRSGKWFERTMYIDTAAKTITLNTHNADYTAVDEALASIPEDLSVYTTETAAAVTEAKEAVVTGLFASQQDEVDAMAEAINKAVAALEKKTAVFTDVPTDSKFYDAVEWAYANGITLGKDATHFSPNSGCTRAQIVTFLWRAAGEPEPELTENPFTDVSSTSPFYKAILWAVENGITSGTTASTFNPNGTCTRAQAVTFIYRAYGSPAYTTAAEFSDVTSSMSCYDAVNWAVENGITQGTSAGKFSPTTTCTRAQICAFLYRASQIG